MNWFKRHLNWTILIAALVGPVLVSPTFFLEPMLAFLMCIISIVIFVVICGWVLIQKDRSLLNLLWLLLGWLIGIIIIMSMENAELETGRETVEYTHGKCAYCGASNPTERIKRGPYYGDERKVQGYTYMWDCYCPHCKAKWYALER